MKYYLYQIRNKTNGMIYIGVHCSKSIKDRYMGSGVEISEAIKKEGKENFEKTIIEYFDNPEDMLDRERLIVDELFIKRDDTYNKILGGGKLNTLNCVVVKDTEGNVFLVNKNDQRYLSGELVGHTKGKAVIRDINGNKFMVNRDDPRYLSGELIPHNKGNKYPGLNKGKVMTIDTKGKIHMVDTKDVRYLSGELVSINKGKVNVIDSNGKKSKVDKDDPRYLSGELVSINKGRIRVIDSNGIRKRVDINDTDYQNGILKLETKNIRILINNEYKFVDIKSTKYKKEIKETLDKRRLKRNKNKKEWRSK